MVKGLARRFSTGAESHNDLEQEGYLALFEALHRFDQGRGVRLGTFIYQSVLSRMLHWRRSQRRTLSQLNAESGGRLQSLDADIAAGDEEMPT
jgi:DNA-directed RNA polymerase specialized sigma subunit